ncbi:MAG TPA: FAD-binding oxidoreductase [Solirubrobacteraceae bacterium]|nr:FAD-binding oxidoreductase [Solirubrobacteraceae bacterium]
MAERTRPGGAGVPQAPRMRWWGWGDAAHPTALPGHALAFLRETVGLAPRARPPVALANVRLGSSTLGEVTLARLRSILGVDGVRDEHAERVLHAAGKGYPDLVRMRAGEPEGAPDAVLYPAGHEQLRALFELCAQRSLALVPFGGGTSVVGGVAPLRGEHAGVLALDTSRMAGVLELDAQSATVTVGAGTRAPALERHLAARGLTLGHFPQSFEYVSLGGCAATRSAGQASSGYGAIERLVLGLRLAAPAAELELKALPASAAGPDLRQLVVGSEGTLGVISELSLRVRPAPRERVYEGVFFEDFAAGVQTLRALAREHALAEVVRLSDRQETRVSLALAGLGAVKGRLGRAYLALRGMRAGCLAILGFEGAGEELACRRRRALSLVRDGGGLAVGRSPGEAWLRGRFSAPYLRDELLTHGVMVETLETACQWSELPRLHRSVGAAIAGALDRCGTPGLVMCHVSHVYDSGASLYFTLIARQREGDEIGQWRAVKDAAGEAILAGAGTITHHHGVGRDHAPWLAREIGEGGVAALAALKAELDPAGIMNPGKLLFRG